MNIMDMLIYISPGIPQAEAGPEGVLLMLGRFGSYTEAGLAAAQSFSLVVHLIAYINLFTCVFWHLLFINMGLYFCMPNCILPGIAVLLQLAGLSLYRLLVLE